MSRVRLGSLPVVVASVAAVAAMPAAARAATFTASDGPSLATAITNANGSSGTDDIRFTAGVHTITVSSNLPTVQGPVTIIDPEGDVTVVRSGSAPGSPLLEFASSSGGSLVDNVSFTRSDGGTAVRVDPSVSGVRVQRSPIFGQAITPIDLADASSNGGVAPPSFRVGPRQADGSLPINGTAAAGTIDAYLGDPSAATATSFIGQGASNGSFSFVPSAEPAAGQKVAATVTAASGTSEVAVASTPADIVSPVLAGARGLSQSEVYVQPSEPIDPASVGLADFALTMAGRPRPVTGGVAAADGSWVRLSSNQPWLPGEAGTVAFSGAGVVNDGAGNLNVGTSQIRVAASPGDFTGPSVSRLSLKPRTICLTQAGNCRTAGGWVYFTTSEPGRLTLIVSRRTRRIGVRKFTIRKAGPNRVHFNGVVRSRKLRAGTYILEASMADGVGNDTPAPPFINFSVRRTTG